MWRQITGSLKMTLSDDDSGGDVSSESVGIVTCWKIGTHKTLDRAVWSGRLLLYTGKFCQTLPRETLKHIKH